MESKSLKQNNTVPVHQIKEDRIAYTKPNLIDTHGITVLFKGELPMLQLYERDPNIIVLQNVYNWAVRNQESLWGRHNVRGDGSVVVPPSGWQGAWSNDKDWAHLHLLINQHAHLAEKTGYQPENVLHQWNKLGWIEADGRGDYGTTVNIRNAPARVIAIRREAIEAFCLGLDDAA